jgi:hypothetical protein
MQFTISIRMHGWLIMLLVLTGMAAVQAQDQAPSTPLSGLKFLLGEWVGEGGGNPGQGSGEFTFSSEVQKSVIVRKNASHYPETKEKAAYDHNDLMVIYSDHDTIKAEYWDNEKHIIHYTVTVAKEPQTAVFVSDPHAAGPQFRLTYAAMDENKLTISFEIATPGKPGEFAPYIKGTATRRTL